MSVEEERTAVEVFIHFRPRYPIKGKNPMIKGEKTFALHPLAEETLEQALAVLADGGTSVSVDGKGVRNFDSTQDHLLHPDGTTAQQRVVLPSRQEGALGEKRGFFRGLQQGPELVQGTDQTIFRLGDIKCCGTMSYFLISRPVSTLIVKKLGK